MLRLGGLNLLEQAMIKRAEQLAMEHEVYYVLFLRMSVSSIYRVEKKNRFFVASFMPEYAYTL